MKNDIGSRIKKLRISKGLNADQLAEMIGKSRATIYRYENGDIEDMPYTVLVPIANALNTTPAYLMGVDDNSFSLSPETLNRWNKMAEDKHFREGVQIFDLMEIVYGSEKTELISELLELELNVDELSELITFAKFLLSKRK